MSETTSGFPLFGELVSGRFVGSFFPLLGQTIDAADTAIPHAMGRIPNGYLVIRNTPGGVVFDGTNHGTDWTPQAIVLRASIAGTYGLMLF